MSRRLLSALLFLALMPAAALAQGDDPFDDPFGGGQDFGDSRDRVLVSVAPAAATVAPGGELPVAIVFDLDPGWHIWTSDAPLPEGMVSWEYAEKTKITVVGDASTAFNANAPFMQWPEPHTVPMDLLGDGEKPYAVYEGRAVVYLPVTIADDAAPGEYTINLGLVFQSCDDRTCLPPADVTLPVTFTVAADAAGIATADLGGDFAGFDAAVFQKIRGGAAPPQTSSDDGGLSAGTLGGFIAILLLAMIGGLILNFTPCVLPIIPLKIMGLAQSAGGNRAKTFALGVAMASGVIAFWLGLGIAMASINGLTTSTLFQYWQFTIVVGVVILIMAISMCGVFTFKLPQFVYKINPGHDSYHGSFGFGVMAAILSTPCTAPFMGAAIAASVDQSSVVVLSVFLAIGVGMGLPYLILSANPKWIERMPRTGPASELIKQVLALLMFAVAAYFIGIGVSSIMLEEGQPASRAYWWYVAVFVIAAGLWLAYRTIRITSSIPRRAIFSGGGLALCVAAVFLANLLTDKGPIDWVYYTPERLQRELDDGNAVMLKFTAEWCVNCHFLERTVINTDDVAGALAESGITAMKVNIDIPIGKDLLVTYDWRSIPYLVIIKPDGDVAFQADWYTPDDVIAGIDTAKTGGALAQRN